MIARLLALLWFSMSVAMAAEPAPVLTFFVEYRTGAGWDHAKPPHEQKFFAEHSAHLKRLREEGRILVGGRHTDKGVLIMQAASADELKRLLNEDPAIINRLFVVESNPFQVFYGGCVPARNKPC